MSKEEIIEGNKFIAESPFSELSLIPKGFYSQLDRNIFWYGKKHGEDSFENYTEIISEDKLKFHSSWDWLMPVVEKISKIKCMWDNAEAHESDTYYPRTFGMLNEETKKPMVRINSNQVFEADTLIEATWLAVTDFIKWYNQIK